MSPHNYRQVNENHQCENRVVNIPHLGPSLGVWHEVTIDYHKVCVDQNESLVCKLNAVLNGCDKRLDVTNVNEYKATFENDNLGLQPVVKVNHHYNNSKSKSS